MKVICKDRMVPDERGAESSHPHGVRAYATRADVKRALAQLQRRYGTNYAVVFRDTSAPGMLAVQYGWAAWVTYGMYVNW